MFVSRKRVFHLLKIQYFKIPETKYQRHMEQFYKVCNVNSLFHRTFISVAINSAINVPAINNRELVVFYILKSQLLPVLADGIR